MSEILTETIDLAGSHLVRKQIVRPPRYGNHKKHPFLQTRKKRSVAPKFKDTVFYEVERIIGAILGEGAQWVLVKWRGWSSEWNYWEKASKMIHCKALINEFYEKYGKPSPNSRKILMPEGERHAAIGYGPEDDEDYSYLGTPSIETSVCTTK